MKVETNHSHNCWNGQISSNIKGPSSKKIQYKGKKGRKGERPFWEKFEK